jgi:hypothetical protein
MKYTNSLFLALAGVCISYAQHNHDTPKNKKPEELLEGHGAHSHPIRTSSPEAQ